MNILHLRFSHNMTRDAAIWTMVGCLIGPPLVLGMFRGMRIMKAYRDNPEHKVEFTGREYYSEAYETGF